MLLEWCPTRSGAPPTTNALPLVVARRWAGMGSHVLSGYWRSCKRGLGIQIPRKPTLPPIRRPLLPRAQSERTDACAKADDGDIVAGPWVLIGGSPHTWRGLRPAASIRPCKKRCNVGVGVATISSGVQRRVVKIYVETKSNIPPTRALFHRIPLPSSR
jgi:hypothetical protein